MSLSSPSNSSFGWLNPFRYNAGRIATYAVMGVVVSFIGEPLRMAGWQQGLSIFGGLVMLIAALGYFVPLHFAAATNPLTIKMLRLRTFALDKFKRLGGVNRFALGALNGLLPCGMVYMALGAAAMQTSFVSTVGFMVLFGLGTAPSMLLMGFSPTLVNKKALVTMKRVYPYAILCVAVLLLIRGMNLGIPYFSPSLVSADSTSPCSAQCCH
jgi:sulfite exporter TauE/SafE